MVQSTFILKTFSFILLFRFFRDFRVRPINGSQQVYESTSQQVSTAHPFGLWAKVRIFVIFGSPHTTAFGVRGYPPLAKARCIALQANAMVLESTSLQVLRLRYR